MTEINYLAVLASGIAAMILGSLWYGPLFGKKWIALMGWTDDQMRSAQMRGMGMQYSLMFLASLLTAYVFFRTMFYVGDYFAAVFVAEWIGAGIVTAFGVWAGFVIPVTISSVLWEGKSWNLWLINIGYNLVSLLAMGLISAFFLS